jgi:hypothetical protein
MADITIERRSRSAWVWWALAIVILAFLVAWWVGAANDVDSDLNGVRLGVAPGVIAVAVID